MGIKESDYVFSNQQLSWHIRGTRPPVPKNVPANVEGHVKFHNIELKTFSVRFNVDSHRVIVTVPVAEAETLLRKKK